MFKAGLFYFGLSFSRIVDYIFVSTKTLKVGPMRYLFYFFVFFALSVANSQAAQPGTISVRAFGDILWPVSSSSEQPTKFSINQAEIDLEGQISPALAASLALAYDPDSQAFALAVLTAHISVLESEKLNAGLLVGQFDVPFGIDYLVYASVDRKLVTQPIFLDSTHGGWNDLGLDLKLESSNFGADFYLVNGDICGRGTIVCPVDRPETRRAFGTHLAWKPSETWEWGFSGAYFQTPDHQGNMSMLGGDFQFHREKFHLKAELISHDTDVHDSSTGKAEGWYAQGLYEWGRLFTVVRYDQLKPAHDSGDEASRWSLGLGYVLEKDLEVRVEQELGRKGWPNTTWLQLVMGFGGEVGPR